MATILFVDDDEMERYFAREVLEPRGHRVLYAGDGETALRVFDQEDVDVVVTDLAMPRLNGLRLIQQLRERDRHVRVIAASGVNADQLDMAEDFGALAVLQKPWDPRAFLDTLQRIMDQTEADDDTFERVWPSAFNDMAIDDEGRLVRTDEEEGADDATEAAEPDDEGYDLGLDRIRLEVEGDDDDSTPEIEIEGLSLDLDEPD
jgi:CheY-like chemotaxis protein